MYEREVVLRTQYQEIAGGHPQQQILLGGSQLGIGLGDAAVGLFQLHHACAVVDGLTQADTIGLVGGVAGVAATARIVAVPRCKAADADAGQQCRTALRRDFQRRLVGGDGGLVLGSDCSASS